MLKATFKKGTIYWKKQLKIRLHIQRRGGSMKRRLRGSLSKPTMQIKVKNLSGKNEEQLPRFIINQLPI